VPVVLHLSPHPDDELIGAPATLLLLHDIGFHVVNVACSLGRRADQKRRRRELAEACRRVGFELYIPDPPARISHSDDLAAAEAYLITVAVGLIESLRPTIGLSPSPHDGSHGHEVVGRAARRSLQGGEARWWMWGIWADLPIPTLITLFDEKRLEEILYALSAHAGEIERNDYRTMVRSRGEANVILAPERVFGFGADRIEGRFAELVTEAVPQQNRFLLGSPRVLTRDNLLAPPQELSLDPWLDTPSARDLVWIRQRST
jgi:LmbE family N-acetylglucosaminyl deacetylase